MEKIDPGEGTIRVRGKEARHMSRVLRLGPGDRLILMDGSGRRFQAVIRSAGRDEVQLDLERPLPPPPTTPIELTLCAAVLKSKSMDYLVQKSSELGVTRIQPFTSSRNVAKIPNERVQGRVRRWREIAINAAKQADRSSPAEVSLPVSFARLMEDWAGIHGMKVLFWEGEDSHDLKHLLRSTGPCEVFAAVVGPEGGFRVGEVEEARAAGFAPVSLGRRILRAETAAITAAAIVQYEWGDLSLAEAES